MTQLRSPVTNFSHTGRKFARVFEQTSQTNPPAQFKQVGCIFLLAGCIRGLLWRKSLPRSGLSIDAVSQRSRCRTRHDGGVCRPHRRSDSWCIYEGSVSWCAPAVLRCPGWENLLAWRGAPSERQHTICCLAGHSVRSMQQSGSTSTTPSHAFLLMQCLWEYRDPQAAERKHSRHPNA